MPIRANKQNPGNSVVKRGSVHEVITQKKGLQVARRNSVVTNDAVVLEKSLTGQEPEGGWECLGKFLSAVEVVSQEIDPDKVASAVIKEACSLIQADRCTLFFVDAEAHELILIVAKGAKNIRIPIGVGIAGYVAETGHNLNIHDAYEDHRFSSDYDKKTGYRTKAVMAVPVRDTSGDIVAVLQCINKVNSKADNFTDEDLFSVLCFSQHIGVTLGNSRLYESERQAKLKVGAMLDIVQLIHSPNTSENSLFFALSNKAHELIDGDRCTLYLVDKTREQLVVNQGDLDFRFPLSKGIVGYVASTGKPLLIDDAYEDKRFSRDMDVKTGYRTKAICCVAIKGKRVKGKKEVVGVLQVINKVTEDAGVFTKEDLNVLQVLLNIAGPKLEASKVYNMLSKTGLHKTVAGNEAKAVLSPYRAYKPSSFSSFEEEEHHEK